MFAAALAGGAIGGAIASRIPAAVLKWTIVVASGIVAILYLVK